MVKKDSSKKLWVSKTFWINLMVVLSGLLTAFAGELQGGATLTLIGSLNIALRVITDKAVKF